MDVENAVDSLSGRLATEREAGTGDPANSKLWLGSVIGRVNSYPYLAGCGLFALGMALVMAMIAGSDERLVAGANPFYKPIKYAIGVTLYTWTLSLILSALQDFESLRRTLSKGVAVLMVVQILGTSIQASLGYTSHYNITTGWDQTIFAAIAFSAAANTVFAAMSLGLILTSAGPIGAGLAAGYRLGLVLFISANFQGIQMLFHQAHTVGAEDGTPGLPFLNWSMTHGDLRVAHVLGLLGLQVMPLFGWLIGAFKLPPKAQSLILVAAAIAYGWLAWHANALASAGKPFLKF